MAGRRRTSRSAKAPAPESSNAGPSSTDPNNGENVPDADSGDIPTATASTASTGTESTSRKRKNSAPLASEEPKKPRPTDDDAPAGQAPTAATTTTARKRKTNASDAKKTRGKAKKTRARKDDSDDPDDDDEPFGDPSKGIELNLPPISNVHEAFLDLVNKANPDLLEIAKSGGISLRVATMCSGTEAPVWALQMVRECFALNNPGHHLLHLDHVFSVECEAFKQAYISRNTTGTVVFRNVLDFVNPGASKAPTAMGSIADIPQNIDILVAGTSCVDFSSLNTQKKKGFTEDTAPQTGKTAQSRQPVFATKEQIGKKFETITHGLPDLGNKDQSTSTFFSMLNYVRHQRPKMVILENVMKAPWDQIKDIWFDHVGYAARWCKADTKHFYIPHTRTRGYLIAIDRQIFGEQAEMLLASWEEKFKSLKRPASTPVTSWLLPPSHPMTIHANQEQSEKALNSKDRDVKWARSSVRHARVRRDEKLTKDRPLTRWGLNDKPYDKMNPLVIVNSNERVKDAIEIWFLRGIKKGATINGQNHTFDFRYKTQVIDLSQNVDRAGIPPFGLTGCITPRGMFYVTDQSRPLSGFEALALQGLPLQHLDLSRETQEQLHNLAGNAMTTTVVGASLVAALISLHQHSRECERQFPKMSKSQIESNSSLEIWRDLLSPPKNEMKDVSGSGITRTFQDDWEGLSEIVKRSVRYCYCNGSANYSAEKLRECTVCKSVRCVHCMGNPFHYFSKLSRDRLQPLSVDVVPQAIMKFLPSILEQVMAYEPKSYQGLPTDTEAMWAKIQPSLQQAKFIYAQVLVTEVVTVCYTAKSKKFSFELRAKLSEERITWYLYLDPWCDLAKEVIKGIAKSPDGETPPVKASFPLDRPIARAATGGKSLSLVPSPSSWDIWSFGKDEKSFGPTPIKLVFYRFGGITDGFPGGFDVVVSLDQSLGLRSEVLDILEPLKQVSFVRKAHCDAPEGHLYFSEKAKLYLFKDPAKTSSPGRDCFVIAKECRQLERHEHREVMVRLAPTWDPSTPITEPRTFAVVEGFWLNPSFGHATAQTVATPLSPELLEMPEHTDTSIDGANDHEGHILAHAQVNWRRRDDKYMLLSKFEHANPLAKTDTTWITVPKHDQAATMELISPITVKLAGMNGAEGLFQLNIQLLDLEACSECSPILPKIQWILQANDQLTAHYDDNELKEFEAAIQRRREPFELQVRATQTQQRETDDDTVTFGMRFIMSPAVLGHRALGHLPEVHKTLASDKASVEARVETQVNTGDCLLRDFEPFHKKLLPTGSSFSLHDSRTSPLNSFNGTLAPLQLRSLNWMIFRETSDGEFLERESEDYLIPGLDLRLVGYASRSIVRRGGILADTVGYGKTVVTLALIHCRRTDDDNRAEIQAESSSPLSWDPKTECLRLKATLVVVPHHLVGQWAQQAQQFLPNGTNVVRIENLDDLPTAGASKMHTDKLTHARIIIVNSKLFSSMAYHLRLVSYTGEKAPPVNPTQKPADTCDPAFRDWYVDTVRKARSYLSRLQTGLGSPDSLKSKGKEKETDTTATHQNKMPPLLELYSFARVVYDEFSYEDTKTSLFFTTVQARSKWILSATPPTRNLATVCGIADLLGVHVARPVVPRTGLPSITEGPKIPSDAGARVQLSYGTLLSDQSAHERHSQGSNFLENFSTAHDLDVAYFGEIPAIHNVVVSNMDIDEAIRYLDLQREFQKCDFDCDAFPRESREILPDGIDWSNSDGKANTGHALILSASMRNSGWKTSTKTLSEIRKDSLDRARKHLALVSNKAIWIANRVLNCSDEAARKPSFDAVRDICVEFEKLLLLDDNDWEAFDGLDGWRAAFTAIFPNRELESVRSGISQDAGSISPGSLLPKLYELRTTSWNHYYELKEEDVAQLGDTESLDLVLDLARDQKGYSWSPSSVNSKDRLVELLGKMTNRESSQTPAVQEASLGEEQTKRRGGPTKAQLEVLCRQNGIVTNSSATKQALVERLAQHELGTLDEDKYTALAQWKLELAGYPFFNETVRSRGAVYTLTRSEVVDVALALTRAVGSIVHIAKQAKAIGSLGKPKHERRCDVCHTGTGDLYFVHQCGHILCAAHAGGNLCGIEEPHLCASQLKNGTVLMSNLDGNERVLDSGSRDYAVENPDSTISSKTQMIVKAVRRTPKDDYVLVFAQFDKQLEELQKAFRLNGITCVRGPGPFTDSDDKPGGKKKPARKPPSSKGKGPDDDDDDCDDNDQDDVHYVDDQHDEDYVDDAHDESDEDDDYDDDDQDHPSRKASSIQRPAGKPSRSKKVSALPPSAQLPPGGTSGAPTLTPIGGLSNATVVKLKKLLSERGLSLEGDKSDLTNRLLRSEGVTPQYPLGLSRLPRSKLCETAYGYGITGIANASNKDIQDMIRAHRRANNIPSGTAPPPRLRTTTQTPAPPTAQTPAPPPAQTPAPPTAQTLGQTQAQASRQPVLPELVRAEHQTSYIRQFETSARDGLMDFELPNQHTGVRQGPLPNGRGTWSRNQQASTQPGTSGGPEETSDASQSIKPGETSAQGSTSGKRKAAKGNTKSTKSTKSGGGSAQGSTSATWGKSSGRTRSGKTGKAPKGASGLKDVEMVAEDNSTGPRTAGVLIPKVRLLKLNDCESAGLNLQYANHAMFVSPLAVDVQEDYDAYMKQAIGRCVRYGQKKTVQVYHFVTANTIEVDMLELRRKQNILAEPGKAFGRLEDKPCPDSAEVDTAGDSNATDTSTTTPQDEQTDQPKPKYQRVQSILNERDVWRMMNERNWLTIIGHHTA